jgi:hypothetical protein
VNDIIAGATLNRIVAGPAIGIVGRSIRVRKIRNPYHVGFPSILKMLLWWPENHLPSTKFRSDDLT